MKRLVRQIRGGCTIVFLAALVIEPFSSAAAAEQYQTIATDDAAFITATDEGLARELYFRHQFGLATGDAFVALVRSRPAPGSVESYGIALSDQEKRDLDSRLAIQEDLGRFMDRAHQEPWFGGF